MNQRLLSLDVFRGMTIFFMIVVNTPGSWNYVYAPLLHAKWNGCTPTDLVFPFFMFIVGVSMSISYDKFKGEPKQAWIKKAIIRGATIFVIGLLLNWFPFYDTNIADLRIFGVLQRIGLAFMGAAILIAFIYGKNIWYLLATILLAYWAILLTAGDGALTLEGNLVRITDLALFGENHIYKGYGLPFDPEGLLSTIPAIGTILLGYLAGRHMMDFTTNQEKIQWLLMFGVGGIIIGLIWSALGFPINKPIWSSSYVLYTGGLAMVLLACMIWVIDVHKIQHWTYVFKAFGQNPLVCYALSGVIVKTILLIHIGEKNLYAWSYDTFYQAVFGNYLGSLMFALSFVLLIWAFAWWMDRKGMIVKV